MLIGQYQNHPAAVLDFTNPLCDHTEPMHIASCRVTMYASQGGAVLMARTARLPVPEHMEGPAILAMFQQQFNSLPEYGAMVPA